MISLDAVGSKDIEYLSTLPSFSRFRSQAAECLSVESVYPSLTYPAHTSMVTGKWPKNHGIVNNTKNQPHYAKPDWYFSRKLIRGTTIYDEMIKKGWRVCSLLWPVTGKSRIQYNLPEIHPNRFWQNQVTTTLHQGSAGYITSLIPYLGNVVKGLKEPALDDFVQKAAVKTIRKHNPEMMLIHYLDVDFTRHGYGATGPRVTEALNRIDRRLGELLDVIEETSDMEQTTICIFGDHYQKSTSRIVYPNYLLWQNGYLSVDNGKRCRDGEGYENRKITEYEVVAKNCDGSCYFYLNPKIKEQVQKTKLTQEVTQLLQRVSQDKEYGIARVLTAQEAVELGADPECICMIEAKEGYYFLDECDTLTREVKDEKLHRLRAVHGYLPQDSDYETFFMMKGAGVRAGAKVAHMTLPDEGATLAGLLHIDLGEVDGRVVTELLTSE